MSARFPWTIVKRFKTVAYHDGAVLIQPEYIDRHQYDEGGGPGLFTRLRLAAWCEDRLAKRGGRKA